MAYGKTSFVLYCDIIHVVKKLSKEKAGELFLTILEYVNDKNPENIDFPVELVFEPIKQQLKRDLKKWEGEKIERKDSGQLGNLSRWHHDLYEQVIKHQLSIEDAIKIVKSRKSHSDKTIAEPSESSLGDKSIANVAANATANVNVNATATTDNGIYKAEAVGLQKVKEVANVVWKDQGWRESLCIGVGLG